MKGMKFALEDGGRTLQTAIAIIHVGGDEGLDQVANKLEVIDIWKSKPLVIG